MGFFLCDGFVSGPGARIACGGRNILSGLSKGALDAIANYAIRSPKLLLDRDGREVKLNLPRATLLADVYIAPSHLVPYNKWRVSHKSDAAKLPEDTLLMVMGEKGFGICDLNGKYLVDPKYVALSFGGIESGRISVSAYDEQHSKLVQSTMDLGDAIKKHFSQQSKTDDQSKFPEQFREGLAVFRDENRLFGYKDLAGRVVIPPKYYAALPFSNGMAPVRLNPWSGPEKGRECYINKTGNIISPIFWRAGPFYGNLAMVAEKGDEPNRKGWLRADRYGLIDRKFDAVIEPKECVIDHLKEGFWVIQEHRKYATVLDANGKEVFRTQEPVYLVHRDGRPFSFFTSSGGNKRILFFDEKGNLLKEIAGEMERHGPRPVVIRTSGMLGKGVRGLMDDDGNWLVKPQNAEFLVVDDDRVIKTEYGTTFVKEDWDSGADKLGNFEKFMGQYKLIGMRRKEVEALLGKGSDTINCPNVASYLVAGMGSWCGNAYTSLQIQYEFDRVKRWRYYSIDGRNDWRE